MPSWSMDNWQYLERQVVTDPQGRTWSVALMDILGQAEDPQVPGKLMEMEFSSARYFTLIYSPSGGLQRERGYSQLPEARRAYENLLVEVSRGQLDPSQPVFREDLED